jgi:hypothetical protein
MAKFKEIFSDVILTISIILLVLICILFVLTENSNIGAGIFALFGVIIVRFWQIYDREEKKKLKLSVEAKPDCMILKNEAGWKVRYTVYVRNLGSISIKVFNIFAIYKNHSFYPPNGEIPTIVEHRERVIEPNHHETFFMEFFRGHEFPDTIVIETATGEKYFADDIFKKHLPLGNIKL